MIRNYGTILKNMCRSPIRYGSPEFELTKAETIIKKFSETKMPKDEKQKIKTTIERLKQEGKL